MIYRIPFNRAYLSGRELEYIEKALADGHIAGGGRFTRSCEELIELELDVPRALLTTSCTHALEMAAMLLGIGPLDEVVLPSFAFVSTANAFALRGARLRFVDIRPDTLNIDEARIEAAITPRTKAIVVVHYAGVSCEMDSILRLATSRGIAVVEDNAHGLLGKYRGRFLGTLSALSTLSFHETKNFSCGEGGALLVNDERYRKRAEILRDKGTDRGRFFRGEVDKYTWVDIGSSYAPSEILSAFLLAQLEAREHVMSRRRHIWQTYYASLLDWAQKKGVGLPTIPRDCEQSYHLFYLVLPTSAALESFIAGLKSRGILSVFHYVPLDTSKMGRRFVQREEPLPVTADISARLVRLPFYTGMTEEEQAEVIQAVLESEV